MMVGDILNYRASLFAAINFRLWLQVAPRTTIPSELVEDGVGVGPL